MFLSHQRVYRPIETNNRYMSSMNTPNGWEELSENEYSSTVAFFKGGGKCVVEIDNATRGDEVLIWQGVSELVEEGEGAPYERTVFEGFDNDEVPDGADYLIEVHKNGQDRPVNHRFGMDLSDARDIAFEEMEKLNSGTL